MKNISIALVAFLVSCSVFSQKKEKVLMEINETPVLASEFKRVYNKNLELVQEEDQKSVDGYLDLFIDYKLKVAEANAQGLQNRPAFKRDLLKYEKQLSQKYLEEDEVTNDLVKEAYERGREQLKVSHILIRIGMDVLPKDSLEAYNKMNMIRQKAINGEDFNNLALEYSEEPGVEKTKGSLNYFSVFDMVYPFESMAYQTPKGEISEIVRSQYGYHIIKVEDRRAVSPKISVSHIMIANRKDNGKVNPKERIEEIYGMLQQGQSFESLAKQFSDDKNSGMNGGKLNPFTKGELRSPLFEEAAYSLKEKGDVSGPVESEFGWHLIRLDSIMPIPSFEEQKGFLERKIREGNRSSIVNNAVNQAIKDKYGFEEGDGSLQDLGAIVSDDVLKRTWKFNADSLSKDKLLFRIGTKSHSYSDFLEYVSTMQRRVRNYKSKETLLHDFYDFYKDESIKTYFREQLEKEYPAYAALVNEYREGLLIFDVMEQNVWNKAKEDTLGQQAFYEAHKNDYRWKGRVEASIFTASSKTILERVMQQLKLEKKPLEIKEAINSDNQVKLILTEGTFEKGDKELPEGYEMKEGTSSIFAQNDTFVLVHASRYMPPSQKSFEEVRGRVMGDYQMQVEKDWVQSLREKYSVKIHQKVLKKVKKDLGS